MKGRGHESSSQVQTFPLTHEERVALIRKPFPITVVPPVKRWGGVQIADADDPCQLSRFVSQKYNSVEGPIERLIDRMEDR